VFSFRDSISPSGRRRHDPRCGADATPDLAARPSLPDITASPRAEAYLRKVNAAPEASMRAPSLPLSRFLVSIAVAGASFNALAQTSNIALYGRVNLDVEYVRGLTTDGDDSWRTRVSSNSSRFGLRGTEELGGGNSVIFQIESSVNADAGGGTIAGRDTFVGLRGAWGTARFGNFKTPYDAVNAVFGNAPTFLSSILDTESVWGNGSSLSSGGFPYRAPNSLRYDLPTQGTHWDGLNAGIHYSFAENDGGNGTLSVGGTWASGPWNVGAVYQANYGARDTTTVAGLDDYGWTLALAYDFLERYRIAGVYEKLEYDTPTGSLRRDFWGISATIDLGPGQLYAFYGRAGNGKGSAASGERVGGLARGSDTAANHYEISYTYPLSKRTSAYAGYVKIDNGANASYNFATNAIGNLAVGGKPEGMLVGMNHNF
jgi:predicted porin